MNGYDVRKEFEGNYNALRDNTTYIVIHHAAALYSSQSGLGDVQRVADYHVHTKKWPGIGYHICLAEETNDGPIARYLCSNLLIERAHTWGRNNTAIGVSCLTNFASVPEQKWIDALVEVLGDLRDRWPHAAIVGHKEIAIPGHSTACPGPAWHIWKPTLLSRIGATMRTAYYQVKPDCSPRPEDNFAAVRQGPGRSFPEANIEGIPYRLLPGTVWEFDTDSGAWWHLANGMGFVAASLLQPTQGPPPHDDLAFRAGPRISKETWTRILYEEESPAAPYGNDCYDLVASQGIDPGVILAIFGHESTFGKKGICAKYNTRSPGNVRYPQVPESGRIIKVPGRGQFAIYDSWQLGFVDLAQRLIHRYIARGLDTIRKAIPVYAPPDDNNVPEAYIRAILRDVRIWQHVEQV